MEFAGTGLIVYEKKEDIVSASSSLATVNLETVSVDTGYQEGGGSVAVVTEGSSVLHCEGGEAEIQSDWVWVEEAWHHQLILPNSFDLLSKESLPIHDPQVCHCHEP